MVPGNQVKTRRVFEKPGGHSVDFLTVYLPDPPDAPHGRTVALLRGDLRRKGVQRWLR